MTFARPDGAVPHSIGSNRPRYTLPALACDSHVHIFDPRFPASTHWTHWTHWTRRPPVATVAHYRQLQQRLGTTRTVVVNPSTYGTDNACLLDALDRLGERARGIAVVGHDIAGCELDRLAARGVCGLRVNFVSPQSWGITTSTMLSTLAHKAARLGWHIQVFARPQQLIAMAPVLAALPAPLVIDHLGYIDPAEDVRPTLALLLRLLDGGNTWVKLSGAYMHSAVGGPTYADTATLGQALVDAAPDRLVWGSDWPHTTQAPDTVDDADLVDLLGVWAGSDDCVRRVLVANPARLYGFTD